MTAETRLPSRPPTVMMEMLMRDMNHARPANTTTIMRAIIANLIAQLALMPALAHLASLATTIQETGATPIS